MTRRRWIADQVAGNRAILTGEHADHLARVLRARVGQEFDVSANGIVRRGRVAAIGDSRVEFELSGEVAWAPVPQFTLLLAIFKFDRMEWVIEKCTELGVARIIPVIARRTVAHLASAAAKRSERWHRIALQAAEQSRRPAPPEMTAPTKLPVAMSSTRGLRIVLSESERLTLLRDALGSPPTVGDEERGITLAVGPEGGWTGEELEHFQQSGWISASLGSTILRAETAAIAATAVVVSAAR
ncbi:MAG TPA: RsmE family RNA methyltransferase [Candidatus Sulfotelmatobacter sp.]